MKKKMRKQLTAGVVTAAMVFSAAAAAYAEDSADLTYTGQLGSWSTGGTDASTLAGNDYEYNSALFVTEGGVDTSVSNTDRIAEGSYDNASAEGIVIRDSSSGHTGIVVKDADYAISDAQIELLTDADGSDTCDFSGKGSAVAVFGEDASVTIEDSSIHTSGVATMPVFADSGSTVTIRRSSLASDGGTLYAKYMNTPDQGLMVAPPWILGIMGTSRCTNLMGTDTTMNVLDSDTSAGAWAVLSTDAGENMTLNVYNSSLTLTNADESACALQEDGGEIYETKDNPYTENYGSGYGSYVIGNASETFAGADINVGTYATIFTGGSAVYTDLAAGGSYTLGSGEEAVTYTAEEDKTTAITSDTFGFMAHQGTNRITIENGTSVASGFATFLVKTGAANEQLTATVDDAEITNGGVLIQVMDNDDSTNGGMMDADDEANTNGGSQNFKIVHTEDAGFDTGDADSSSAVQQFTFSNGTYSGNIYNASGSDGLSGSALYVALGSGASLSGAAAETSAIHVTYDGSVLLKEQGGYAFDDEAAAAAYAEAYQNTSFDITEYWSIGQVANLIHDNGANAVYMTLTDDAVWNVSGTSHIAGLSIEGSAQVVIPEGVTLTVGGTDYTDCTLTAADEIAAGVPEISADTGTDGQEMGGGPGQGGMDGPGQGGMGGGGQPPQMPDGNGGPGQGGQPPQMPDGNGGPGEGGQPPQMPDGNGGPGENGQGGPGGGSRSEGDMANANTSVNKSGAVSVTDNTVSQSEELPEGTVSEAKSGVVLTGISLASGDYSYTGISASDSDLRIERADVQLDVDEAVSGDETAGAGLYTDSGTTVLKDSTIEVNGAGRYSVAAEGNATFVVDGSVIAAGGDSGAEGNTASVAEPFSNAGLLISGTSRANFSVGSTHTFYYNSLVTADGWAALSTDSATGSGLEFVACGTEALALHGGYGLYADTNCRDYLYGSTIVSAEVGAILSNNGSVTTGSAEDAESAVTADGYAALAYREGDAEDKDGRTVIIAGRNAVMLHSPDMMGDGNSDYSASLALKDTALVTDASIGEDGLSYTSAVNGETYTIAAEEDYAEKYGEAVGAYLDYVSGAAILVKSTSAEIELDNVTVDSMSGVALQTVLNSDSMSRYLKQDIGNGVHVTIRDSEIEGSFIHDDYQRDLALSLEGSTITGAVTGSDAETWNAKWEAYADDENCCWYGLDASVYVTDTHATTLSLADGSVWNVTGESYLTSLRVSADSAVNGTIAAASEETLEDGTVVYTDAVVTA